MTLQLKEVEENKMESLTKSNRKQINACPSVPTALQFSTQTSFFVPACAETENRCACFRGLMLNRGLQFHKGAFFLVVQYENNARPPWV